MNTKEVFEKSINYGSDRLGKEIEEYNRKCTNLGYMCDHEIIFKYNDNQPKMMMIDGYYFCPACGRAIECLYDSDLKVSPFKKSKVVPLTNLSLITSQELYSTIRNEVYSNYDFYYNPDTSIEEMQMKMESVLIVFDVKYSPVDKLLQRLKK